MINAAAASPTAASRPRTVGSQARTGIVSRTDAPLQFGRNRGNWSQDVRVCRAASWGGRDPAFER
jgi:hypothetical protein